MSGLLVDFKLYLTLTEYKCHLPKHSCLCGISVYWDSVWKCAVVYFSRIESSVWDQADKGNAFHFNTQDYWTGLAQMQKIAAR